MSMYTIIDTLEIDNLALPDDVVNQVHSELLEGVCSPDGYEINVSHECVSVYDAWYNYGFDKFMKILHKIIQYGRYDEPKMIGTLSSEGANIYEAQMWTFAGKILFIEIEDPSYHAVKVFCFPIKPDGVPQDWADAEEFDTEISYSDMCKEFVHKYERGDENINKSCFLKTDILDAIQSYPDFQIQVYLSVTVPDKILQTRSYKYPHDVLHTSVTNKSKTGLILYVDMNLDESEKVQSEDILLSGGFVMLDMKNDLFESLYGEGFDMSQMQLSAHDFDIGHSDRIIKVTLELN